MRKRHLIQLLLILCTLIFIFPTMVSANIHSIIQGMEKSYQRQMSSINDITIVQEMKGGFFSVESTIYQKKSRVNGQEVFKSRSETSVMGMDNVTIFDGEYTWSIDPETGEVKKEKAVFDPLQPWKMFKPEKMEYLGEEKVDNKDAYKVQLNDAIWMMGKEDLANSGMQEEDSEVEMYSIYWIDKKDYVPLKSRNFIKTTTIEDGKPVVMDMVTDVDFLDYRLIESMLISHRMVVNTQIDVDDPSLSQQEKEEAKAFMSAMGGMGNMEFTVKSVEVNKGLSDDLFDGTKLEPGEPMFGGSPSESESPGMQLPGGDKEFSQEDLESMMESFQEMMQDMAPNN